MGILGSEYQDQTAYHRYGMSGGGLDWGNQPSVFREYPQLPVHPLSESPAWPDGSIWDVMCGSETSSEQTELHVDHLAAILYFSAGLTARTKHGSEWFYFRAPASAGALYPSELYCATRGVRGLEDGLYHFTVSRFGLTLLRKGNIMAPLDRLMGVTGPDNKPGVTFLLSAIFFRSAWKYKDRAYRYCLFDTGHLLENLLLSLKAFGMPCEWRLDFENAEVERFLGIDDEQEGALALVRAYGTSKEPVRVSPEEAVPAMSFQTNVLSPRVQRFDKIVDVHRSTGASHSVPPGEGAGHARGACTWEASPEPEKPENFSSFAETVKNRRSKRNYVFRSISRERLGTLLRLVLGPGGSHLFRAPRPELGVLVGGVADTAPGFYRIDPQTWEMALVRDGNLLRDMANAALNQTWLAQAAVHFVMSADLKAMESTYGPRTYRHVMLKAGMLGQRVYLAATGLGMGACGIGAFYDTEASEVLGLGANERMLYLVAAGPVKK